MNWMQLNTCVFGDPSLWDVFFEISYKHGPYTFPCILK